MERQHCNFFLLRYVPDAVKNEFVNVGLVFLPPTGPAELRFTHDWSRVKCLDAEADVDLLQALEADLRDQLHGLNGDRDLILRRIQDSFSNAVQPSEFKACLAESPAKEADELARLYLERQSRRGQREQSTRQFLRQSMQREFERAGVWPLMRKEIPAAQYTRPGDPLKIDCGYSPNGTVKLFHALAVATDPTSVKSIAFTFPRLVEGIRRAEHKATLLTAVVEDNLDRADDAVAFSLDTLEEQGIRISRVGGLGDEAARDLGL